MVIPSPAIHFEHVTLAFIFIDGIHNTDPKTKNTANLLSAIQHLPLSTGNTSHINVLLYGHP